MTRYPASLLTVILLLTIVTMGTARADMGGPVSVEFGRYPAPSSDGNTLAFSWAGDLWTVPITGGQATRLTSSTGYDWNPIWSPDGSKIAFMSDRYGSEDLYVINARGGTPERITFSTNNDYLSSWLPDGSGLVFSSRRGGPWPDNREPHIIYFDSPDGYGPSAPEKIFHCPGYGAVYSPDESLIAFEFGPGNGYREGYRGTHKEDIWVYNTGNGQFTQVTNNDVGNMNPTWSADGSLLYYRSEESGVGNLWSWNPAVGNMNMVTHVRETGLWHPRIGGPAGAEVVAYEWMGGIYIQSLPDGDAREIRITAWLDEDPNTPYDLTRSNGATEYKVSPDGNEIAFVVRGEIFCVRTDGIGGTTAARLTNHPARDWEISWYPRGDAIMFTSDRDGYEQIYWVVSDDPDHERLSESHRFRIEKLFESADQCWNTVVAPVPPDAEEALPDPEDIKIAYTRNRGDLWLMDGNGDNHRQLYTHWGTMNIAFSPDARWLAYSRQDDDYNIDVFIAAVDPEDPQLSPCPTEGWQPFPGSNMRWDAEPSWADGEVNITRHPDDDWMPVWSPDGTKIGFTASRNLDNIDAYFVFLQQSDEERSVAEWEAEAEPLPPLPALEEEKEEEPEEEPAEDEEEMEEEEPEEEPFVVNIDFANIHSRARRLTSGQGNETLWAISPNGETIVYSSNTGGTNDLWSVRWTGEDTSKLAGNVFADYVVWHPEANRIFYLSGSRISSVNSNAGDAQTHNFRATLHIDPQLERLFKFNEVWREENRQFYDPDFHGTDWAAMHDDYKPLVMASRHYRDFNDAMNTMLGRMNASHLSFRDAERGPYAVETGYAGWGLASTDEPGMLVEWITPFSPITEEGIDLDVGDRIVNINGYDVGGYGDDPIGNWWRAMEFTHNTEIEIGIIDHDSETGEPRWVRVTPTGYSGWNTMEYEAWLAGNRDITDELSSGQFGYLHIPRMYEGQMERFEQDLFTVGYGMDGLIIDVRWNSGGWVSDLLLTMLNTPRHALTRPRDGDLGYPEDRTPFYTTTVPIVVLVNEYSYSNAEVFAHAINNLDRGLIIGWPTAGGVISTGGTTTSDGSYLSLPRRGWWALDQDTGELMYGLEHNGVIPDVLIYMLPDDIAHERDPQLATAIENLLNEIGMRP